jgi:hypothetical protein
MYFVLSVTFGVLCLFEAVYIAYLLRRKSRSKPDTTASELLSQLLRGGAVVVTQVVNPADLFLWSPRDSK